MIPGNGSPLGFSSSVQVSKAGLKNLIAEIAGGESNIISIGVAEDATIDEDDYITSLPCIVGATLTASTTELATLETIDGYPAANFNGGAVTVCAYAMPKNAKTAICVARNDKTGAANMGLMHVNANAARLISTASTSWLALTNHIFYRNGAASAVIDALNHTYMATSPNTSSSATPYLGSVPESGAGFNFKGPVWAWCQLSITASAAQAAQIHAAFKAYFRGVLS